MALTQRLDLRQTQALVMTPQLQQAIKLLQLSNLELSAFIETELEQNPLLERDDTPADGAAQTPASEDQAASATDEEDVDRWRETAGEEGEGNLDLAGDPAAWRTPGAAAPGGGDLPGLDQTLSRPLTLREHLLAQLSVDIAEPVERIIGTHLVDMTDDAGYLRGDLADVADRLDCDAARVEATLAKLQLLAGRDAPALMHLCGVDAEDLAEMVAELRALNPKPGLAFDTTSIQSIVPDVLVRLQGASWIVELNNDTLPRVLVNNRYYAEVSGAAHSKAERDYLVDRYQQANWLAKALHQRATTILKVATEILRQQEGFFRHGVRHLRPLLLRDIAEAIGMHDSTVSRVTSGKYMATPRGIYELKYFFTAAIAAAGGGAALSAEAVRFRIKALIEAEADEVLSDDRVVEILLAEGIDIARRTVAKYREAMRIPSSVQRRRDRALPL